MHFNYSDKSKSSSSFISETKSVNGKVLVGGIIFDDTFTQMLLIKGKVSGKWGVPKGHREPTESNIDGAFREIFEETGLRVSYSIDLVPSINCKKAKLFLLSVPSSYQLGVVDTNEIEDMRWISLKELDDISPKTRMLETIAQKIDSLVNKARYNKKNYSLKDDTLVVGQLLHHKIKMMMNSSTVEEIVEEISSEYRFLSRQDIENSLNNLIASSTILESACQKMI